MSSSLPRIRQRRVGSWIYIVGRHLSGITPERDNRFSEGVEEMNVTSLPSVSLGRRILDRLTGRIGMNEKRFSIQSICT